MKQVDPTHTNIINKHFRTAEKGSSSDLGFKTLALKGFTLSLNLNCWLALPNMTTTLQVAQNAEQPYAFYAINYKSLITEPPNGEKVHKN
jgi:hypothetical protein